MSNDLQNQNKNNNPSEELDLVMLFNLIGKAFNRFFNFIGSIFKAIFSVFIYALKAIVNNFKLIGISMFVAVIIGFGLEHLQPDVYSSQMVVKPYFDSKYQLVTNINYYNALIRERDFNQLKELFEISKDDAEQILNFEINSGPETENDRIVQYDEFIKSIDSIRAQNISFDDFVENRSIYTGDIFEINVMSTKKDIFRSLEKGLNTTFTNTYSRKKMLKRDSLISIDKARINNSLKEVDSLKKVYIAVMEQESKSDKGTTIATKDGVSLIKERTNTREFDLLEKQIKLRQDLSALESQKVEEDVFFDTISGFQDVGAKYVSFWKRYSIIFPILTFLLLALGYSTKRVIKYVKNYEA
ncbi:MAG: hypothetical protein R2812_10415 [Gelidibacter sp.]